MPTLSANYLLIHNFIGFQTELSRLDSVGENQKPALDQDSVVPVHKETLVLFMQ